MASWHDVYVYQAGDYEEVCVTHEHPEPAEDCELTLWLGREDNWTAFEDLGIGTFKARIHEGLLEVTGVEAFEIIDVTP